MKVAIIDYGMGNIHSLMSAILEVKPEIEIELTKDHHRLYQVDALFLPGVGHFGAAVKKLNQYKLIDSIRDLVLLNGKPIFGICLGMQLLFANSDESPKSDGLGLVEGNVVRMKNEPHKIPHIGFNSIIYDEAGDLLNNIESSDFYFVHSYAVKNIDEVDGIYYSKCIYNDNFFATIEKDHVWGTQFHPEKSQRAGLRIIENFLAKYVY